MIIVRWLCIIIIIVHTDLFSSNILVMLDPAPGPGRCIDDTFERGITLQCIDHMRQAIEQSSKDITVVTSSNAGEYITQHQKAHKANTLHPDLFISIRFYKSKQKSSATLYTYAYSNFHSNTCSPFTLYPYHQAYIPNYNTTQTIALHIKTKLEAAFDQDDYIIDGPYALPLAPLIGITSPAIVIECGIHNSDDWHAFVNPVADSIVTYVHNADGS